MRIVQTLARNRVPILNVLFIAGLLYVVIPKLDELQESIVAIQDANFSWLVFAIVAFFLGMPLMAAQLNAIALKPLRPWVTYKVQMAALFVNKLVPSGLGLPLLIGYYLKRSKHSTTQVASVLSISALTSASAFGLLVAFALVFSDEIRFSSTTSSQPLAVIGGMAAIALIAIIVLWLNKALRHKLFSSVRHTWHLVRSYKARKADLTIAALGNGMATLTSVIALFACSKALGVPVSGAEALVIYTLGNVIGNFIPIPGGLGGVDAGLYGGMIVVGLSPEQALSTVLLYRLITYWLAITPGFVFFLMLKRDVLSGFSVNRPRGYVNHLVQVRRKGDNYGHVQSKTNP